MDRAFVTLASAESSAPRRSAHGGCDAQAGGLAVGGEVRRPRSNRRHFGSSGVPYGGRCERRKLPPAPPHPRPQCGRDGGRHMLKGSYRRRQSRGQSSKGSPSKKTTHPIYPYPCWFAGRRAPSLCSIRWIREWSGSCCPTNSHRFSGFCGVREENVDPARS